MTELVKAIGVPAMLEQTAEEANELAFACLKLARMLRGENKVHGRTQEELLDNLAEEMADISVCIGELTDSNVVDAEDVKRIAFQKMKRMRKRLLGGEDR